MTVQPSIITKARPISTSRYFNTGISIQNLQSFQLQRRKGLRIITEYCDDRNRRGRKATMPATGAVRIALRDSAGDPVDDIVEVRLTPDSGSPGGQVMRTPE